MAVMFAMNSVLDRLGKSVVATLTAQGEEPASLPRATTAEQAAFYAAAVPATVLGVGETRFSEDDANIGSVRFCQEVTLHHVRALEPGGSAVEIATARLAAVAAALYADFHLNAVSEDGDQPVEMVRMLGLVAGDKNEVQAQLDQADQAASLCVVSLRIEIDWVEIPDEIVP